MTAAEHAADHEVRLKLYNKGLTDYQLADVLGVPRTTIFSWRKRNGLEANVAPSRNRNNEGIRRYAWNRR
jgi:uncharacterized protein YjcR